MKDIQNSSKNEGELTDDTLEVVTGGMRVQQTYKTKNQSLRFRIDNDSNSVNCLSQERDKDQ